MKPGAHYFRAPPVAGNLFDSGRLPPEIIPQLPNTMAGSILAFPSTVGSRFPAAGKHPSMRADLVEQAAQVIPDPPVLINMVSKRVKQLALGRPALVDRRPGLREADIALLEIIQGKIKIEDVTEDEE